jgi:Ca-activated chloride channel family protein
MTFAAPEYLWLLPLILLPLAALRFRAEVKRKRALEAFADAHLVPLICQRPDRFRRITGTVCGVSALLLLTITLMRPQWGIIAEEQTNKGLDIVIALDISQSMRADDLQPNRLAVAKSAINTLLDTVTGDRIGIIAFSGTAFTVCPLTGDYAIVRQIVNELSPESLPQGGSAIAAALREAQRAFRGTQSGGRILMLISDGEDHAGDIAPSLQQLRGDGVTVLAALAGTEEGGLMPLAGGGFVKDRNGAVVKSHASPAVIKSIDPASVSLNSDKSGLAPLLQRSRATGIATERKQQRQKLAERFQLPLAAALLFLGVVTVVGSGVRG